MTDELPPGWAPVLIRDIADVNPPGSTVSTRDDELVSFLPMASVTELTGEIDLSIKKPFGEVKKGFTRFKNGDVVFAKITPSMENGKVAVARDLEGGLGCGTTEFHVIRPEAGVEPDYLRYYFVRSAYRQEARRNMQGAVGQQRVPPDFIRESAIPVAPSDEQKRIVSKIDELFSRIDEGDRALERVQKLVERYRQSVLKAAVTGELTREWREKNKDKLESGEALLARILNARRDAWEKAELAKMKAKGITPDNDKWKRTYAEPAPPDTTGLPELPAGWVWASPVQLESSFANALTIGPFGSNLKVPDYRTEGVPLIFVRNIRSRSFSMNEGKFVSVEKAQELATHTARAGDVLITKMGDPPGDACVYPVGSPNAIITADCIKWTLHPLLVSRHYFAEFINSALGRSQIADITKGVAQQKVSLERFRQIAIALPGPEEQSQIAERLEVEAQRLDEIGGAIARERRRSSATRQSILRAAFAGSLVRQDSTDEPASILLERIASERATGKATPKFGRKKKTSA